MSLARPLRTRGEGTERKHDLERENDLIEQYYEKYWQRTFFVSLVLSLLGAVWFLLVLYMKAHAINKLKRECTVTYYIHFIGTLVCGVSVLLQVFSFTLVLSKYLVSNLKYCVKHPCCDDLLVNGFTRDWRDWHALQRRLASLQVVLQAVCAFGSLPSFVFNVLGLSLSTCLWERQCTAALRGDSQPFTWTRNVIHNASWDESYAQIEGKVQMVSGNHSQTIGWQSNLSACVSKSCVKVAVDLAEPLTLRFSDGDVLQIKIVIACYLLSVIALSLSHLFAKLFGSWSTYAHPYFHILDVSAALGMIGLVIIAFYLNEVYADAIFVIPMGFGFASLYRHVMFMIWRRGDDACLCCCGVEKTKRPPKQSEIIFQILRITYGAGVTFSCKVCLAANIWPGHLNDVAAEFYLTVSILLFLGLARGHFYRIGVQLDFEKEFEELIMKMQ